MPVSLITSAPLNIVIPSPHSRRIKLFDANQVDTFVEEVITNNRDALEKVVENFVNINLAIRRDSYIYSMSETYESNPLWAFYANNNQGFCIE